MLKALPIEPESPERLRDCLSALARHTNAHVLRIEVSLGPSTRDAGETSITMTVTHSLGQEHEEKIGPKLAEAFFGAIQALADIEDRRERSKETP